MEHLDEVVRNALQMMVDKNGIHDFKINISRASNKGDNFLGDLLRIEVIGVKNGEHTVLSLVCKVPQLRLQDNPNPNPSFEREINMYKLLENFERFQIGKHIPENWRFTSYALCHSADASPNEEYLILEDLAARSFVMLDKLNLLDEAHARLVVEGLAKFHAISFVMKDQVPAEFEQYTHLPELLVGILGEKAMQYLLDLGLSQALSALEKSKSEHIDKVRMIKESSMDLILDCMKGVGTDYCVVTHGDCWNNNTMFRYENGIPVEVCFIDWQITRYTSPIVDLSNYFYLTAERELLQDHFDDLMDLYHDHLSSAISLMGGDPKRLYPYEIFQRDLKKFAKFGLIFSSFGLNTLLCKPKLVQSVSEFVDMTNKDASFQEMLRSMDDCARNIYDRRIQDNIRHAAERHFI